MRISIETIPACVVACVRRTGPYGAGNVRAMEELKAWAGARQLLNDDAVILGIARDDPAVTAPENCRYDACLVVPDDFAAYGETCRGAAAGGRYAVFTVQHTAQAVQKAWREIFPELKRRGLQADLARPIIERYAAGMVQNHLCEICVPVTE